MHRKTVLRTATLAVMAATAAMTGTTAVSAGGYGNSYKINSGYARTTANRSFAHIRDRVWRQHADWCHTRFKTYNTFDNTYQPYSGPRQQCWSPYIAR
ncbi:BA14K family protein [Roseibium sp.]|uniref:BA14K family protein n=1 Tax=Roseibium sp. TaxID=1936156 RepID=UPI003267D43D